MKRFLCLTVLLALCSVDVEAKPPKQGDPVAHRFYDSMARQIDTTTGSAYPWWSDFPAGTISAGARGEKVFDAGAGTGDPISQDFAAGTTVTGGGDRPYDISTAYLSLYIYREDVDVSSDLIAAILPDPAVGGIKAKLRWQPGNTNKIQIVDGVNAVVATSTVVIRPYIWYRVDFKLGTATNAPYELRVHEDRLPGTTVDVSGTSTFNGLANNTLGEWGYYGNTGSNHFISDPYLSDSAYVADGNDYRVESIFPDGDGNYTQWTGSYLDIDEIKSDLFTTKITTGSTNQLETFTLEDLAPLAPEESVLSVMLICIARTTSNGTVNLQLVDRLGGTDRNSTNCGLIKDTVASNADYRWWAINDTKPTGGAWTETDVNNLEGGVRSNSNNKDYEVSTFNVNVLIEMPPLGQTADYLGPLGSVQSF